jgi:ABC-type branched-subunit amino acid transport system substrate-binding protein
MQKIFLTLCSILILAGCAGSSTPSGTWSPSSRTAGGPPQTLAQPQDYQTDNQGLGPYAAGRETPVAPQADGDFPPVKVALLLPLSGQSEALGQAMLQAAQLALFDLGANTFELLPRDTGGTATGARSAAQDVLNEGASLILGPLFSGSVSAVKPLADRANVNMIAFSTDWNLAGGNTYLMGFMPFSQVERITNYAALQGLNNVALITTTDSYGQAVERTFVDSARRNRVTSIHIERLSPERVFMYGPQQVAMLQQKRPQAVFIAIGGQGGAFISQTLAKGGMEPRVVQRLGTGLWDDPALAREPSLNGALFAAPSPSVRTKFENNYANLYGTAPPRLASLAYDATALAAVLGKMGRGTTANDYRPAYNRAALQNPAGFAGIDGVFRFGQNRLVQRGLAILEFRNGRIIEVDPAPRKF